jgi:hypothetical protein
LTHEGTRAWSMRLQSFLSWNEQANGDER